MGKVKEKEEKLVCQSGGIRMHTCYIEILTSAYREQRNERDNRVRVNYDKQDEAATILRSGRKQQARVTRFSTLPRRFDSSLKLPHKNLSAI